MKGKLFVDHCVIQFLSQTYQRSHCVSDKIIFSVFLFVHCDVLGDGETHNFVISIPFVVVQYKCGAREKQSYIPKPGISNTHVVDMVVGISLVMMNAGKSKLASGSPHKTSQRTITEIDMCQDSRPNLASSRTAS